MPMFLRVLDYLSSLVALILLCAGQATAASLEAELSPVARSIAALLKERGQKAIAMGSIAGPPQTSAGPGIGKELVDELGKLGVRIKDDAALRVQGKYTLVNNVKASLLAARITVEVLDRAGKSQGSFTREVRFKPTSDSTEADGAVTLASLLAVTVNLPPDAHLKVRQQRFRERLDVPQAHTDDSRISAAADSLYAVEVLVEGKPRKPTRDKGLAFVEIKKNETYVVRLSNNSDSASAATLTIDGLSMFAFSEHKNYVAVIIPAKTAGTIRGWHRNNDKSDAFQVTAYPDSAAAKMLPASTRLGTITATFAAAWPVKVAPPKEEAFAQLVLNRGEQLATGRGAELRAKYQEVECHIGVVRSIVSVRYTKD